MHVSEIPPPGWPMRRRIFLMRHGDVSYFDEQGRPHRPDQVPLNAEGRRQAELAGRELAGVPLDRVLASDLPRSVETAALVTAGRGLTIETQPALREIRPGRLADIEAVGVEQAFLGAFGRSADSETRFLGGETFGALVERVLACFRSVLADPDWRRLLIVAHGGVNRVLLAHALGLGLEGIALFEQDACCLNIVDADDAGRFLIRLLNHTAYNPAKHGLELTTMERLYLEYRRRSQGTGEGP
jgi:probable phosphoglycerate mutase